MWFWPACLWLLMDDNVFLDLINFVILQILNYLSPFFPAKRNHYIAIFLVFVLFWPHLKTPSPSVSYLAKNISISISEKLHLDNFNKSRGKDQKKKIRENLTFWGSGGSRHRWRLRLHLPVSERSQCQWFCFASQPVEAWRC